MKRRLIPFIQKYHQEDELPRSCIVALVAETVCDFMTLLFQATQVDRSLLADLFTSMVRTMKDVGRNGVIEQR